MNNCIENKANLLIAYGYLNAIVLIRLFVAINNGDSFGNPHKQVDCVYL